MSYRPVLRIGAAAALTLLLGAAAAVPASAAPASSGMVAAVARDLGLSAAQAEQRLATEQAAALTDERLSAELGQRYAGSWLDPAGGLVVGTTDAADSGAIRAAGASPQVRANSQDDLDEVMTRLNDAAQNPQARSVGPAVQAEVGAWYVDAEAGSVVVEATNAAVGQEFAARAGDRATLVAVREVGSTPRPYADLVGGDAIFAQAGGRCSIGFSATSGAGTFVITAGHCTELGGNWLGSNQSLIGPVADTAFPGDDYGTISVTNTAGWTPTSQVLGTQSVQGSTVAAIGASTCRSGSTTGYQCGVVQSRNATVNYGGGDVVYGLTRTDACAEPGDSGGSFVSGRQAQGMTSGGSGDCQFGGSTYFQPVNEALSALGLTLVTG